MFEMHAVGGVVQEKSENAAVKSNRCFVFRDENMLTKKY